MGVEALKLHLKGNSMGGKESKHERNVCFENPVENTFQK